MHTNTPFRLLSMALIALLVLSPHARADKPINLVFILADDLGWADTQVNGDNPLYETPNLNRLAERSVNFTRAYTNSPLCSPTRATILTGQTPARHGSTAPQHHIANRVRLTATPGDSAAPNNPVISPQTATRLNTNLPTLSKLMRAAGYRTAHFGKWHLGPAPFSALEQGFEVDIPHWAGPGPAGSFVAPWRYPDFDPAHPKEHIEDRMAQEAADWIKTVKDQPFYLNYWQFSVHAPFNAKQSLIDYYRKKIDALPSPNNAAGLPHSATYAAMVHSLDDAIGTLLDALDAAGVADHTAIIFISDNGGNMYNVVDENTRATTNHPLRGGKASMWDGGVRVPCLIRWPGITNAGTESNTLIQTADFYPTILSLLDIDIPSNHPVDGTNIAPALAGEAMEDRGPIFTYFPHNPPVPDWIPPSAAVYEGDWKLIRVFHENGKDQHSYKLFNLAKDIGETVNLAAKYPDKVKDMDQMLQAHLDDAGALTPQANPKFDPSKYNAEQIGKPRDRFTLPKP